MYIHDFENFEKNLDNKRAELTMNKWKSRDKIELDDIPIYLNIIAIILKLFKDSFFVDGKFKIRLWQVLRNVRQITKAFQAVREELKKR